MGGVGSAGRRAAARSPRGVGSRTPRMRPLAPAGMARLVGSKRPGARSGAGTRPVAAPVPVARVPIARIPVAAGVFILAGLLRCLVSRCGVGEALRGSRVRRRGGSIGRSSSRRRRRGESRRDRGGASASRRERREPVGVRSRSAAPDAGPLPCRVGRSRAGVGRRVRQARRPVRGLGAVAGS